MFYILLSDLRILLIQKKSQKSQSVTKNPKNNHKIGKEHSAYTKKKNKKTQRTRRQRGYFWEDTLVKRFNSLEGWKAFRLGSPSVALPDVLAVNNEKSTIFTIEAKSGTVERLPVPSDQILRCLTWTQNFKVYKTREVVLAFKFLSKKRVGTGQYERRELREFYKVWDGNEKIVDCVCTYEGETYALNDGRRSRLNLRDFQMPFKSKHRILL